MVDQIFLLVVSESVRAQYHHVIIITVDSDSIGCSLLSHCPLRVSLHSDTVSIVPGRQLTLMVGFIDGMMVLQALSSDIVMNLVHSFCPGSDSNCTNMLINSGLQLTN